MGRDIILFHRVFLRFKTVLFGLLCCVGTNTSEPILWNFESRNSKIISSVPKALQITPSFQIWKISFEKYNFWLTRFLPCPQPPENSWDDSGKVHSMIFKIQYVLCDPLRETCNLSRKSKLYRTSNT